MWDAILNVGGWVFFYLLLLFHVRWSILEQVAFIHEDPENWEGTWRSNESPADHRYHMPAMGFPALSLVNRTSEPAVFANTVRERCGLNRNPCGRRSGTSRVSPMHRTTAKCPPSNT